MASLLAHLARGLIFAHRARTELSPRRSRRRRREHRRGSHVCKSNCAPPAALRAPHNKIVVPNDRFLFARQAPDLPRDCQVISTSAYSVRLAWTPAFAGDDAGDVTYNIKYRLKYNEDLVDKRTLEINGIVGSSVEIMSLLSCSLYEFRIQAVSR